MKFRGICTWAVGLILFVSAPVRADVSLPSIIGSHMVLQRDMPVRIFGWAEAGEKVSVEFAGKKAGVITGPDGKWLVTLPAMKASSKPMTMLINSDKSSITLEDILIGEVWVGSGQSNMEWTVTRSKNPEGTIAAAKQPEIRLFQVPKVQKPSPDKDVIASWKECTPENIPAFSAVLYHFGAKLNADLDVPVGLINSSWGGSAIEPWIIKEGKSGGMYNGMIAPLQPFTIRGVTWYQGETNALQKNGLAYYGKMQDLINGWRKAWGSDLPFYYVQIAPWDGRYEVEELPKLWEAQVASLKIPGTGMVVTTDIVDNLKDIHPANKKVVGDRLALWALAKTYGKKDIVYSGPLYKSMKVEGNKIRLAFAHAGTGLKTSDGKALTDFEIAGADGKFVTARAEIDGTDVVVSSPDVAVPTQARFGWTNVSQPNLVNSSDLPASPFRTKDWKGGTGE
jgi:sialate O-acetylesterase